MNSRPSPQRHSPATGAPTPPRARYEIVDVLRGFALLGVFVANAVWMSGWFALTAEQRAALPTAELDAVVSLAALMPVEYKFYTLFSILFGMGFAMQLGRSRRAESDVLRTYVRRQLILLVIGVAHGLLLWFGDILHVYALLGLVLVAFRDRSDRELLGLLAGLALLVALLPLLQWLFSGGVARGAVVDESVEAARYAVQVRSDDVCGLLHL